MLLEFNETSYGIVKRLNVVEAWTHALADQLGKQQLSILDVGCGTGDHITFPLASLDHDVIGIDFHEASINEARTRYALPNLTFRCSELDAIVQEKHVFDLVICSEVLEHVRQPSDFLLALRRLVRPDGALIITTPNGYGPFEMLCRFERLMQSTGIHQAMRTLVRFRQRKPGPTFSGMQGTEAERIAEEAGFINMESGHVQFFSVGKLEKLFSQAGFSIRERRARTLLCGPYVDVLLRLPTFRQRLYRLNNRLADILPFSWSSDWMFLLQPLVGRTMS